jgi:hypothetical protein
MRRVRHCLTASLPRVTFRFFGRLSVSACRLFSKGQKNGDDQSARPQAAETENL